MIGKGPSFGCFKNHGLVSGKWNDLYGFEDPPHFCFQITPGAGLVPLSGSRPGTLRFEAPARGGCLDQLDLQGSFDGS